MKVSSIFESIAKTKTGQKFYKWCASPGKDKFLNNTLPTVETVVSTGMYCYSTAKQKKIDKDRRKLLQYQNVLSGLAGVVLGTVANRWISNQTESIVKDLDPKKLDPKVLRKVSTGLRIMAPLMTTAILMRLIIPTVIAGVSGKIMDKERAARAQNKLDTKA